MSLPPLTGNGTGAGLSSGGSSGGVIGSFPPATELSGENRVPQIIVGTVVPLAISAIVVLMRLYSRIFIIKRWWIDDTLVVISLVTMVGLVAVGIVATQYGSGYHIQNVPIAGVPTLLKLGWVKQILYPITMATCKASVCFFYLRLFLDKIIQRTTIAVLVFIIGWAVPCILVTIFQCTPIDSAWMVVPTGKCISTNRTLYLQGGANILIDIILIVIVVPQVLRLQLPKRQKYSLLFLITLSWLGILAAIIRLVRITEGFNTDDPPWVTYDTGIWNALEVAVSNLCVSIPGAKPIFDLYFPRLLASTMTTFRSQPGGNTKLSSKDNSTSRIRVTTDINVSRQHHKFTDIEMQGHNESSNKTQWSKRPSDKISSSGDSTDSILS